ncbi:MAG TPA: ferredoxin [Aquihabitans sp.]|jgi:ferredoxin|nr:ferredoxin [Aquihabitans sp.]
MRITLDLEKCQGHGRCYALAPTLFDSDDEGYAVLLVDAPDGTLSPEQEEAAVLAADNCPEYAIEVHDR